MNKEVQPKSPKETTGKGKGQGKTVEQAMKAQKGRCLALLFL